jgi:GGDEF domain-containing protein
MSETPEQPEAPAEHRAIAPGNGTNAAEPAPAATDAVEPEGQRLRRTALALGVVVILTTIWLWPSDWGANEIVGVLAIIATLAMACVLAFQLAQLLIDEPISEVWRVLRGEPLSVRSKTRFLTRLQHECSDAQLRARNRDFSLAVFALDAADEAGLESARGIVRHSIRSRDVMSDLGAGEIWVLALGAGADAVEALARRLRDAIGADLRGPSPVAIGWSTFNEDAFNAKQMIASARQRAGLIDAQVAAELEEAA